MASCPIFLAAFLIFSLSQDNNQPHLTQLQTEKSHSIGKEPANASAQNVPCDRRDDTGDRFVPYLTRVGKKKKRRVQGRSALEWICESDWSAGRIRSRQGKRLKRRAGAGVAKRTPAPPHL